MRESEVAEKYVRVIQDMYEDSKTEVRCAVGVTDGFKAGVRLHHGSALSPFLFAVEIDKLTVTADVVICSKSKEQVEVCFWEKRNKS